MKTYFRKMPGLLYDWISMASLKLNERSKWINSVTTIGNEPEDYNHIAYWMERYEAPDDSLKIFFYLPDRSTPSCFMEFFTQMMRECRGAIETEEVWKRLSDVQWMKELVAKYYFKDACGTDNLKEIAQKIRESDLPEEIRAYVLEFFIDPEVFLVCLLQMAREYHQKTKEIYDHVLESILNFQESIGEEELMQCFYFFEKEKNKKKQKKAPAMESAVFSASVIMKNTLLMDAGVFSWFVLGLDYTKAMKSRQSVSYVIENLCNAAGDHNRAVILDFIKEEGEKNCNDVAKKLNIALNTASYHLDVMKRAKLLSSRSQGKTNYYWINSEACQYIIENFERWGKQ